MILGADIISPVEIVIDKATIIFVNNLLYCCDWEITAINIIAWIKIMKNAALDPEIKANNITAIEGICL